MKNIPAVKKGIRTRAGHLLPSNLMTLLLKCVLDDSEDTITLGVLEELTGESQRTIKAALEEMADSGLLKVPDSFDFDHMNGFRVGMLSIALEISAAEKTGQAKMDLTLPAANLSSEDQIRAKRRSCMWEKKELGGTMYTATVLDIKQEHGDGTLYYRLMVVAQDLETYNASGRNHQTEVEKVCDPEKFHSIEEAFAWWDEWFAGLPAELAGDAPLPIGEWVAQLEPFQESDGSELVSVDFDTFSAFLLAKDLGYAGTLEALETRRFVISTDESGEFPRETVLLQSEGGHRWPGLDLSDQIEAAGADVPAEPIAEPPTIYDWAAELPLESDNHKHVDVETFAVLVPFLWEGTEVSVEETSKAIIQEMADGITFVGDHHWKRSETGARWPGLDPIEPAPASEESLSVAEPANLSIQGSESEFPLTLEDGERIQVKTVGAGRGRINFTWLGAIDRTGIVKRNVPKKDHDGDIEGYALREAETMRKDFVATTHEVYPS